MPCTKRLTALSANCADLAGRLHEFGRRRYGLAKDYERMAQTSETLIEIAATRLVLRRIGRHIAPQEA